MLTNTDPFGGKGIKDARGADKSEQAGYDKVKKKKILWDIEIWETN